MVQIALKFGCDFCPKVSTFVHLSNKNKLSEKGELVADFNLKWLNLDDPDHPIYFSEESKLAPSYLLAQILYRETRFLSRPSPENKTPNLLDYLLLLSAAYCRPGAKRPG